MTELGYKTLRESIVDIIRKRIINRELQPGRRLSNRNSQRNSRPVVRRLERHCANWRTKAW